MTLRFITLAAAIAGIATTRSAAASNYLQNAGFEQWNPFGNGTSSFSGVGAQATASQGWFFANFNNGSSTADEATPPPGLQNAGQYSLLVTESVAGNTIHQPLGGVGSPVNVQSVSGWVYLVRGTVGIDLEDSAGNLQEFASTSAAGQWVHLAANTGLYAANGFYIVALSPNTKFYADNMDADSEPLYLTGPPPVEIGPPTRGHMILDLLGMARPAQ